MRDLLQPKEPTERQEIRSIVACPWGREALENGEVRILKVGTNNAQVIESEFQVVRDKLKGALIQFEPEAFTELYRLEDFDEAREAFKTIWQSLNLDTSGFSTIVQGPVYKGKIKSRQAEKFQVVVVKKELFDDKISAIYEEDEANLAAVTTAQRKKVERLLRNAPEGAYRGNAPFMPSR